MAFKMAGFNPGKGTGMGSAFQKKQEARLQMKMTKKLRRKEYEPQTVTRKDIETDITPQSTGKPGRLEMKRSAYKKETGGGTVTVDGVELTSEEYDHYDKTGEMPDGTVHPKLDDDNDSDGDNSNGAKKAKPGSYVKPGGKATGKMKDYALGSEARKKEYDARGWKYDDTIKGYNRDGTPKEEEKKSDDTKKVEKKKDVKKMVDKNNDGISDFVQHPDLVDKESGKKSPTVEAKTETKTEEKKNTSDPFAGGGSGENKFDRITKERKARREERKTNRQTKRAKKKWQKAVDRGDFDEVSIASGINVEDYKTKKGKRRTKRKEIKAAREKKREIRKRQFFGGRKSEEFKAAKQKVKDLKKEKRAI